MKKAWLIAAREMRWELFGDRGSLLRSGLFLLLPLAFVVTNRGAPPGRLPALLFLLAAQTAVLPALTGVALIASTFAQEKENQTLVPLLAAPIRDIDIVVGKLMGMLIPIGLITAATLGVFFALSSAVFGLARVAAALPLPLLLSIYALAFLYILTTGSWVLIIAARVRSSRAAGQLAGLVIAGSFFVFGGIGAVLSQVAEGWPLVAYAVLILLSDVVALEIARRAWQRGEVIARV